MGFRPFFTSQPGKRHEIGAYLRLRYQELLISLPLGSLVSRWRKYVRVLSNIEMSWIAGGWDSVDEITIEAPSDDGGGSDDGNWDDQGGDDSNDYDEGGGGSGGPEVSVDLDVVELLKFLKDLKWEKPGILGNEVKMKVLGGYDGQHIDPNNLKKVATVEGIDVYSYPTGDLGGSKVYYADRDGNGSVDTGVIAAPENNLLGWDYNTDGHIDEIVTN
jgi:hypothetical protein